MRGRRRWLVGVVAVAACLARHGWATVFVPMSDTDLARSSDLVVVGVVEEIETALLARTRMVTRVTVGVEQALMGEPGDTVVITEPGGEIAGTAVVLFGAPEYAVGERVLVFLRRRADGSLGTNALAFGKYHIDGETSAVARRTVPTLDERPLAGFLADLAALVPAGAGVRSDGRAGAAIALPDLATVTDEFTFSGTPPSRWFEPDCSQPIAYGIANFDVDAGEAASRGAIADATAAWSAVPDASIVLAVGPDTTPTPSLIGGTFDGSNRIQFNDPFNEVEDLVGCTGVLARGGFVGASDPTFPGLTKTVGSTIFGRIFEGDVTFNDGLGACFPDPALLAEVAAHEIGHSIGFAHSSENPTESDPTLADALMYFRAHNDGRGASPHADDIAGLVTAYPNDLVATGQLPTLACEADLGILGVECFDQSLSPVPFTRFAKARAAVRRAAAATVVRKQKKQLKKALVFLAKTDKGIDANVTGACAMRMHTAVGRLRDDVTVVRATL